MTTISPGFPSQTQAPGQSLPRPVDPEKLAAQRAIFAQLTGKAPAAAAPSAAAPARAAEPAVTAQAATPNRRPSEPLSAQPTKYLRPGSLLDIRV